MHGPCVKIDAYELLVREKQRPQGS